MVLSGGVGRAVASGGSETPDNDSTKSTIEAEVSNVPNRETFETMMYAGKAPWDIGKPQPALVEVAGRVTGAVLDAGCGTAARMPSSSRKKASVLGIDFLDRSIQEARRKAEERGLNAEFIQMDALTLNGSTASSTA